jgi:hypothetical protein
VSSRIASVALSNAFCSAYDRAVADTPTWVQEFSRQTGMVVFLAFGGPVPALNGKIVTRR